MKKALLIPVIASGCMEYDVGTNLPPQAVPTDRPIADEIRQDKILQVTIPKVDVLWVVDNSCSMYEEQQAISSNNPRFLQYFQGSGLDYHIGVVSTDMNAPSDQGKLEERAGVRWLQEDTPNKSQIFSSMIELGTGGHYDEMGIDATYAALEVHKDGYNAGFLRDDASLHVIVVSDEGDYSWRITPAELAAYLNGLKPTDDMVTFSSIVSPRPTCWTAAEPGDAYVAVTQAVGGIYWSICNDNWVGVLEQLGMQATGLKREYFLSQLPVVETIQVKIIQEGVTIVKHYEDDFYYVPERNSIVFHEYVPDPLAELYIEYQTRRSQ